MPTCRTKPEPAIARLQPPSPLPASEHITLRQLAKELKVKVERLRPLVEHHYLKLLSSQQYLDDCMVARPYPDGMRWLRNMLAPLTLQPMMSTNQARAMLNVIGIGKFRSLCVHHDIQIYDDPVFGEVMNLRDFYTLYHALNTVHSSYRCDRQMMLQMMTRAGRIPLTKITRTVKRVIPYDEGLEAEIKRVARLEEPHRTFRALSLWEAFKDANTVHTAVRLYKKRKKEEPISDPVAYKEELRRERIEALLRNLVKKSIGTLPTDERPPLRPYVEP